MDNLGFSEISKSNIINELADIIATAKKDKRVVGINLLEYSTIKDNYTIDIVLISSEDIKVDSIIKYYTSKEKNANDKENGYVRLKVHTYSENILKYKDIYEKDMSNENLLDLVNGKIIYERDDYLSSTKEMLKLVYKKNEVNYRYGNGYNIMQDDNLKLIKKRRRKNK